MWHMLRRINISPPELWCSLQIKSLSNTQTQWHATSRSGKQWHSPNKALKAIKKPLSRWCHWNSSIMLSIIIMGHYKLHGVFSNLDQIESTINLITIVTSVCNYITGPGRLCKRNKRFCVCSFLIVAGAPIIKTPSLSVCLRSGACGLCSHMTFQCAECIPGAGVRQWAAWCWTGAQREKNATSGIYFLHYSQYGFFTY